MTILTDARSGVPGAIFGGSYAPGPGESDTGNDNRTDFDDLGRVCRGAVCDFANEERELLYAPGPTGM